MRQTPHLTRGYSDVLEQQIRTTRRGMAHFANTGPFGATCGECISLGYFQQRRNDLGVVTHTTHRKGCEKFYRLTGEHGDVLPFNTPAGRYFTRKGEEQ